MAGPVDDSVFAALSVERIGDVLKVTIDRPPLNAIDEELHGELTRLFRWLRSEADAPAVVLTGAGAAFSAGGDFDWFPSLHEVGRLHELRHHARQLVWDLVDIEVPVIAAVNGPAIGLGATIALLCDIILMADTATIADPHVLVGIVAGDGGSAIWPLLVGPARAKQYLLTGEPLTAFEAERIGLVNRVVSADRLQDEALQLADRLAGGAPLAIQYTKAAINQHIKDALSVSFEFAAAHELVTLLSDDHKEALAARREHRRPKFKGR